jgi:predicted unusual protein kinase regulating ubiquinone biosynthesis (AarF/ABC1/UbiB family)
LIFYHSSTALSGSLKLCEMSIWFAQTCCVAEGFCDAIIRHVQTVTKPTTTGSSTGAISALPPLPPDLRPFPVPRRRRFLRVSWFFFRVIVHVFIFDILFNRYRLTRWYAQRTGIRRYQRIARDFRRLAVRMGGVLIKLGQFLSARADVLPAVITDELAGLQDEVPPAPLPYVLQTLITELRRPPADIFARFDPTPVAAASLGQVYYGELRDGRAVAVKIQRPRIDEIVEIDLSAVLWAVRIVKNYPLIRRRADLELLFEEFARVLREELDYEREAQHALRFRINFADTPGVYFPKPYPELSTRRVLIMERISGIKISDYAALERAGVDRTEVATRLNRAYLKQFFLDGFFHADPHPGNIFVRVEGPPPPQTNGVKPGAPFTLILLDCGMVGYLPPTTMEIMRSGVIGLATNDPERIVDALDRLGMILPGADRRPIVQALQIVLRHTYARTQRELTNIDVEKLFDETEHLVRDLPFQIPQDLIYLGRAISLVSGIVTGLHPDINLFEETQPFAQAMLDRERKNGDWLEEIRREVTALSQVAATLPRQMDAYYKAANRGELQMRVDLSRLERGMKRVERATNRLSGGIIAAALFIGGVLLRINGFADEAFWSWAAAAGATLWTIWPRSER